MISEREFAIDVARKSGRIMLKYFKIGVQAERKADNSFVTLADKEINQLVIDAVRERYPDYAVLGEEASVPGSNDCVWVCDPIDGTNPYRWGVPTIVFSLALVKAGRPILAVVLDPYMDRLYLAQRGKGATVNGAKLSVNTDDGIDSGRFACSVPVHKATELGVDLWGLRSALERTSKRLLVSTGSSIYEGLLVASGQITGAVFPGSNAHDIATRKLIIEEAGGQFTDIEGNEQRYDRPVRGGVASNVRVHPQLLQIISEHRIK